MKLNHCDSFVIYRKPYSKEIHIIVGNWTDENNSHNKTGFMFNEFPSSNPIFLVGKKSLVQHSIVVEHSKKEKSPLERVERGMMSLFSQLLFYLSSCALETGE